MTNFSSLEALNAYCTNREKTMTPELTSYIADYVNEELSRGASIDKYTITDAIMSFEGGAPDMEDDE